MIERNALMVISHERCFSDGAAFYCENRFTPMLLAAVNSQTSYCEVLLVVPVNELADGNTNSLFKMDLGRVKIHPLPSFYRMHSTLTPTGMWTCFKFAWRFRNIINAGWRCMFVSLTPLPLQIWFWFRVMAGQEFSDRSVYYIRSYLAEELLVKKSWVRHFSRIAHRVEAFVAARSNLIVVSDGAEKKFAAISKRQVFRVTPSVLNDAWLGHSEERRKDTLDIRLLFVGRLVDEKRIDYLIEAAALLQQSGQAVQVKIVGDGRLEETLQALADQLQVEIEFCGMVVSESALIALYDWSDLVILPSATEAYSKVLDEALARGRPVVASSVLARERKDLPGSMVLFSPDTAKGLADAIRYAGNNYAELVTRTLSDRERLSSQEQFGERLSLILAGLGQ